MGGVEVVTSILANKFVAEGCLVSVIAFASSEHSVEKRLDSHIKTYILHNLVCNKENIYATHEIMRKEHIQIVINQWGLPVVPIKVACEAARGLNVKIISVYHNAPDANGRIQGMNIKLHSTQNGLKRIWYSLMKFVFAQVTSKAMRYNYLRSNRFLVLSESYINVFQKFTHLKDTPKLRVMKNPVTIDSEGYGYDSAKKQKEIIYVGRLDFIQKRVSRVLDTWKVLEKDYPDWRLTIVGDGEERRPLEQLAQTLELERVSFEGFQSPLEYYKHASILVLTSEFEGFPLVLAEAMSFGVVPVVYNSFAAVRDIIDQGKDGIIVPKVNGTFSVEEMAKGVELVIKDLESNQVMPLAAMEKSKRYSLDEIYRSWIELFEGLKE